MSKSLKSALLSGLVFPGAGHLYLKKYRMASILVVITLVCLSLLIMEAIEQAMNILEQLESSGAAVTSTNIMEISERAAKSADTTMTSLATLFIVLCWLVGIIDSYRSGKQSD